MASVKQLMSTLHMDVELFSADDIADAVRLIIRVEEMSAGERDTIRAAFTKGPISDGDVPSKSSRDQLVKDGFIAKVVAFGQEGYNACTYRGAQAYRLIQAGA